MNGLEERSASVNRAVFLAVALYFALIGYAAVANDPLAALVADFVFGVIAVGVGIVLYVQSEGTPSAIVGAAGCLIVGGLLQFAYLFSRIPLFNDASSLVVFAGVGLYIYAVFTE